jgi:hypothetical protein
LGKKGAQNISHLASVIIIEVVTLEVVTAQETLEEPKITLEEPRVTLLQTENLDKDVPS